MPKTLHPRVPSYRRHRPSGQALVTLNGHDFYLGRWRTAGSRREYDRLIAEWLAADRQLTGEHDVDDLTVTELIARYFRFAKRYYRKAGESTGETENIRYALRPMRRLYGRTAASAFKPTALRAVRLKMIELGWARTHVNRQVDRIRRMFKWAVSHDLVPPDVYHGLQAVAGLRKGRCDAREPEPVRPVADAVVDATLPHVSPTVAAMIQLQRLTGMRSAELVIMRGCDLDTSGKVWTYVPATHKTEHHGHGKTICLGPRAQAIIRPLLKADLGDYLFSPRESETERRRDRHRQRKTPLSCGNRPGTNRKRGAKRRPRDRYATDTYRRAIDRGCAKAFPPPDGLTTEQLTTWKRDHRWHPHQLRHSAATRLRKEYGLEAARVVLGHRSAAITELYAEVDQSKAIEIMAAVG